MNEIAEKLELVEALNEELAEANTRACKLMNNLYDLKSELQDV